MNKLYVTGDTHQIDVVTRFSFKNFPEGKELDKGDFVTILGDWGVYFNHLGMDNSEKYILDWMAQKPFSWFIVLGNHENYKRIYEELPLVYSEKVKGMVRKPRENVYIAETGEVYEICGKRILVVNGAPSHDISDGILDPNDPNHKRKIKELSRSQKRFRVLNVSWWAEEIPSEEQKSKAKKNAEKYKNEIDYVFAHDCPSEMFFALGYYSPETNEFHKYLQTIWNTIENPRKKWYFGHHHVNFKHEEFTCLYEKIERLV